MDCERIWHVVQSSQDRRQHERRGREFHDLRGTAAIKFYNANIPIRVIAEIMAWDEATGEKIIRRYVDRNAATKALIAQINLHREEPVKPLEN